DGDNRTGERCLDGLCLRGELGMQDDERTGQNDEAHCGDNPPRHVTDDGIAPILHALPVRREVLIMQLPLFAYQPEQVALQLRDLALTARIVAILALVAERKAHINQLDQIDIPPWVAL